MTDPRPFIQSAVDPTSVSEVAQMMRDLVATNHEMTRHLDALRAKSLPITQENVSALERLLVGVAYPGLALSDSLAAVDARLYRAAIQRLLDPTDVCRWISR